jgi:hypothetical protein
MKFLFFIYFSLISLSWGLLFSFLSFFSVLFSYSFISLFSFYSVFLMMST